MILTLDTIGERYGLLPSEVLSRGSTLDIYVMDVALSYHDKKMKEQQRKYDKTTPVENNYSVDELQEIMSKVKKKK